MRPKPRIWIPLALVGLLATFIGVNTAGADPSQDEPVYYVDGARPAPDADASTLKGCVPWAADRLDVNICGPIADDWVPPAAPHQDAGTCEAAQDVLAAQSATLLDVYGAVPKVDPSTCLVIDRTGGGVDRLVEFNIANQEELKSYQTVIVAIDDDEGIGPFVSLS